MGGQPPNDAIEKALVRTINVFEAAIFAPLSRLIVCAAPISYGHTVSLSCLFGRRFMVHVTTIRGGGRRLTSRRALFRHRALSPAQGTESKSIT